MAILAFFAIFVPSVIVDYSEIVDYVEKGIYTLVCVYQTSLKTILQGSFFHCRDPSLKCPKSVF